MYLMLWLIAEILKDPPQFGGVLEGWQKLQRRLHHKNNYWQKPDYKIE